MRADWTPDWTLATGLGTARPAYVRVFEYPRGYRGNVHRHLQAQLIYPERGVARVSADRGEQVLAPYTGVFVPSWCPHRVSAPGTARLYSFFVDPTAQSGLPTAPTLVPVTPLLHELVREAGAFLADYSEDSTERRVVQLVVELIARSTRDAASPWLPAITHTRIRRALSGADLVTLSATQAAERAALSPRQFARVFRADTGMSFKDWRALHRIQTSLALLAQGKSVTAVASELSFSSTSAFIAVFRRHLGATPSQVARRGLAAR